MGVKLNIATTVAAVGIVVACGCSWSGGGRSGNGEGDGGRGGAADAGAGDAGPTGPRCERDALRVLRAAGWPGGGVQLALQLRDGQGAPLPSARYAEEKAPIELAREDGSLFTVKAAPYQELAGLTALVIVPDQGASENANRVAAAKAMVEALPDDERIGVWLGNGDLPMLVELTERREHLLGRIGTVAAGTVEPIDPQAWSRLASAMARVTGPWGPVGRNLVVIGSDAIPEPGTGWQVREGAIEVAWLRLAAAPGAETGLQPGSDAAYWGAADSTDTPERAAKLLSEHIEHMRAAVVLVGACGPLRAGEPLSLRYREQTCEGLAPAAPEHLADSSCDALQAARDGYPYPETIELQLTEQELATHDAYATDKNEADFTLRVALGQGAPIKARAHFRGQTSLDCKRKSYSVNLTDGWPRRLMPGSADDEFYLISMCKERYYFRQVLASRIMNELGLFPLRERYVRLRVAGRELGVYLLLEKPKEALKRNNTALSTVIRRRLEANRKPAEAKFPDPVDEPDAAEAALEDYRALVQPIGEVEADALHASLSDLFDIDGYLSWLALASYLQCGDYVDETFFYASPELGADGVSPYFRNCGWDMDDLFMECHHKGRYAYPDPYEIAYCAEAPLDEALFVSPDVYARFVDEVQELTAVRFSPDAIEAMLIGIRDELFAVLTEEAVCGEMVELLYVRPEAVTCDLMRQAIETDMGDFAAQVRDRAALLQSRIDAFRAEQ